MVHSMTVGLATMICVQVGPIIILGIRYCNTAVLSLASGSRSPYSHICIAQENQKLLSIIAFV